MASVSLAAAQPPSRGPPTHGDVERRTPFVVAGRDIGLAGFAEFPKRVVFIVARHALAVGHIRVQSGFIF
jgi:hypothetical protein